MTTGGKPRILVVEDDPDQQLLYTEFLGREGFDIETAATADQALASMNESVPAALILDMAMSGSSGLSVLNSVRENPKTSAVPIIVVTGVSKSDDLWQGREWGWDHYVEKPADIGKLAVLLREVTAKSSSEEG
ncbi:MAG: response regulator [Actinomycetota bacterium]|nr:response regulator [Actinomycetota bacterium]